MHVGLHCWSGLQGASTECLLYARNIWGQSLALEFENPYLLDIWFQAQFAHLQIVDNFISGSKRAVDTGAPGKGCLVWLLLHPEDLFTGWNEKRV